MLPLTLERKLSGYYDKAKFVNQNKEQYTTLPSLDTRTEIKEGEFAGWFFDTLVIPECIENIGAGAFCCCENLESVKLPNSLHHLSEFAFAGCTKLKEISIPDNVKEIGEGAFYECKNLEKVHLPNSLYYLSKFLFAGCEKLKEISIPESIEIIEDKVFYNCKNLESVKLPDSLRYMKEFVFANCIKLKEISRIPDNVEEIGKKAFSQCKNLEKIHLPNSLSRLEISTFANCEKLREINIPDNVAEIGKYVFQKCKNLEKVHLPNALNNLDADTFVGCEKLKEINIPDNVKKIGVNAFNECKNLEEVHLPNALNDLEPFTFAGCEKLRKIHIPESVTLIGENVFKNCTSLVEAVFISTNPYQERKVNILKDAFEGCKSLKYIVPNYLTKKECFNDYTSLRREDESLYPNSDNKYKFEYTVDKTLGKVTITGLQDKNELKIIKVPEFLDGYVVREIKKSAFSHNKIVEEIWLPDSITQIDSGIFEQCENLKKINFPSVFTNFQPIIKANKVFSGFKKCAEENTTYDFGSSIVDVAYGCEDKIIYRTGLTGKVCFSNKFLGIDPLFGKFKSGWYREVRYEEINLSDKIFMGCTSLKEIKILDRVKELKAEMFRNCSKLVKVELNLSSKIENMAFSDCSSIEFLYFKESLEEIGENAFSNCNKLKYIRFPSKKVKISKDAFLNCGSITSVQCPSDCTEINKDAFREVKNIKYIIIPEETECIGIENLLYVKEFEILHIKGYKIPEFKEEVVEILKNKVLYTALPKEQVRQNLPEQMQKMKIVFKESEDKFDYFEVDAGVHLKAYLGDSNIVNIPDIIDGLPVTSICQKAFDSKSNLEEIGLPDTVKEIGDYAFSNCKNLKYVILSKQLESIGKEVFNGCSNLRGIRAITDKKIDETKLYKSMYLITEKNTVRQRVSQQSNIYFSEVSEKTWTSHQRFNYSIEGTYAVIKKFYTELKSEKSLIKEDIKIPEFLEGFPVKRIEEYAFSNCLEIKSIEFPYSLEQLGEGAFYHCTNISKILLGQNLKEIGNNCFARCISLLEVNSLSDSIFFGKNVFAGCSSLRAVCIQAKDVETELDLFADCPALEQVYFLNSKIDIFKNKQISYNFEYSIQSDKKGIELKIYNGNEEKVKLPTYINGLPLKCLKKESFKGTKMKKVYLPNTIDEFEEGVFLECTELEEIQIPSSVTKIPKMMFYNCKNLKYVSLHSGIVEIGEEAFCKCKSILELNLPNTVKSIGNSAFEECEGLLRIYIDDEMEEIGNKAFKGCKSLRHIKLPESIKRCGYSILMGCSNLRSILNFSNCTLNIKKEDKLALLESELQDISENNGFEFVYNHYKGEAFIISYSKRDKTLKIPKYNRYKDKIYPITEIGDMAFAWIDELESVTIPENIQRIGSMAFYGCKNLKQIVMEHRRDKPFFIGTEAFFINYKTIIYVYTDKMKSLLKEDNCSEQTFLIKSNLEDISYSFEPYNKILTICANKKSVNMQNYTEKECIWSVVAPVTEKIIFDCKDGNNISKIGNFTFSNFTLLKGIEISDGVEYIGKGAFLNCTSLEWISLPDSLTVIGENCFQKCTVLMKKTSRELSLPQNLRIIGRYAFKDCREISSVRIPESIDTIGSGCFYNCSALKKVYFEKKQRVKELGNGIFLGTDKECEIYLRFKFEKSLTECFGSKVKIVAPLTGNCAIESDKKYNIRWSLYFDGLLEIDGSGRMKDYCNETPPWTQYSDIIQRVVIGEGITHIGDMTFYSCNFESIYLPKSLESIGIQAFAYCRNLKKIVLPNNIKEIKTQAFQGCTEMKTIMFMKSISDYQIQNDAFENEEIYFYNPDSKQADWIESYYPEAHTKEISEIQHPLNDIRVFACLYKDGLLAIDLDTDVSDDKKGEISKSDFSHFGIQDNLKEKLNNDIKEVKVEVKVIYIGHGVKKLKGNIFSDFPKLQKVIFDSDINEIEVDNGESIDNNEQIIFVTFSPITRKVLNEKGVPYNRIKYYD